MGIRDSYGKKYFQDPERCADLINYCIYHGEARVAPKDLKELDPTEILTLELEDAKGKAKKLSKEAYAVQKMRDILKSAVVRSDGKCIYAIFGVENQTDLAYAMPVRNLMYDGLEYMKQVHSIGKSNEISGKIKDSKVDGAFTSKFLPGDKLTPVVTIVVYWGPGEWTAPRSFREMLPDDTPEEILQYTPDYKIPVVAPGEIENFEKFRTEIGDVFRFVAVSDDTDKMRSLITDYLAGKTLNTESVQTLNAFLNISIPTTGKETNMCKAFEELTAEAMAKGEAEGEARGEARGTAKGEAKFAALVSAMSKNGEAENIAKAADDSAFRETMYKKYNL